MVDDAVENYGSRSSVWEEATLHDRGDSESVCTLMKYRIVRVTRGIGTLLTDHTYDRTLGRGRSCFELQRR
jgi:hypothetical protein